MVPVTGPALEARYLAQLAAREARAAGVSETAVLWPRTAGLCDTCPARRLPGVQASLALGWPDLFRVRVDSFFGTALDLSLAGDSLRAYAPAQHAAVLLDAERDSLGVSRPGGLAVRLLSAAWRPPSDSWPAAAGSRMLRWSEGDDSVLVGLDDHGRPELVELRRGAGAGLRVVYEGWASVSGVMWPTSIRMGSIRGDFEIRSRISAVTFGAGRALRLAARIPVDADLVGRERLMRWLRRLEAAR
jgi:hypothetical protein